jgi:hypothetical protein
MIWVSLVSTSLCAALTVVVAYANRDALIRWRYMSWLSSDDPKSAERGVSYLIRHAGEPAVMDHVRSLMRDCDDRTFDRLVAALSTAGHWGSNLHEGWVRYLVRRLEGADPRQRGAIAVELGKLRWRRLPGHDDPRLAPAIQKLLGDPDGFVRLNALSAAACLPDPSRVKLVESMLNDPEPEVARHASIMREILAGADPPASSTLPSEANSTLRQLAKLELMPARSADIPIASGMPAMIRLQAVRVSRLSQPADLSDVFDEPEAALRDLACWAATQRFTPGECRELAKELIASFSPRQRMAGAMLGGMAEKDGRLMELLAYRAEQGDDWTVQQHYRLALAMQGVAPEGFEPISLLGKDRFPHTTLLMAMVHMGRLEAIDWLLEPFGSPPVDLRLVLDTLRFQHVLMRYVPMPAVGYWADPPTQARQIDYLRDWHLIRRPELVFDPARRRFTSQSRSGRDG